MNGVHEDGFPWSGAYLEANFLNSPLKMETISCGETAKTVFQLINDFETKDQKVHFAFNGGYILNPELVGKLGIGEEFVGSPLGLFIQNGKVLSLPLFNKPALVYLKDGRVDIIKANLMKGFNLSSVNGSSIRFKPEYRNKLAEEPSYYDLLSSEESIIAPGKLLFRLAGNKVAHRMLLNNEEIPLLPIGLSLLISRENDPGWKVGDELKIEIPGWTDVQSAIEAGPTIIKNKQEAILMEEEGWKTAKSIRTQAARIDFLHMRGPKIAVGIKENGSLIVVAVNGRIRESVGATHGDMAKILLGLGVVKAMGMDPGGSTTIIADGQQLNITPYNKDYFYNPISLPAQARPVGNAFLAY